MPRSTPAHRSTAKAATKPSRSASRPRGWSARIAALAASPHALAILALVSAAESFIFPIPPDALLIPMVLAARERWFRIAAVCTVASVVGAVIGYGIGALAFSTIGEPILGFYGLEERFDEFSSDYNTYGTWAVLIAGITPIPFKLVTILSGTTAMPLMPFILACAIARGARFFLVALLLWYVGPSVRTLVERRLGFITSLIVVAAAAVVLVLVFLQ